MSTAADALRRPARLVALSATVLLLAVPAAAQVPNPPQAVAVRTTQSIQLDGRLDEAAWQTATPIGSFRQLDPEEGEPASERTEVRILYDDDNIYVGGMLYDREPVSSRLVRRDISTTDADRFNVAFDSYHDHLTAFRFHANPAGVRRDTKLSGGQVAGGDVTWDPVWDLKTEVTDTGWVVEMRIPFSQIPFAESPAQEWGFQVERYIARRQEESWWAFVPKSETAGPGRYGHLGGLEGIQPGGGFELLPYGMTRADYAPRQRSSAVSFANPFRDRAHYVADAGIDLKYRLASNLTLDATFNPDFGQVEVDPAVVNLTAFETRFQENRPFFVAGSEVFHFGGSGGGFGGGGGGGGSGTQLLYSRRIGGPPSWRAPSTAIYSDLPEEATILGAAKLTGRTAGGWNLGVLEAVTGKETARYTDASGVGQTATAAPVSNFLVVRAQRTFRNGGTQLGGIATTVARRLGALGLADELRAGAHTIGADWNHQWANRAWALTGFVAGSRISGRASVIAETQRSSARYFQRPDADYVELDPAATSLSGYSGSLDLRKQAGLHWRGNVGISATSPGFEVNDLGFQRDADRIGSQAAIRFVQNQPGRHLRNWNAQLQMDGNWNYGWNLIGSTLSLGAGTQLRSYWGGNVTASRSLAAFSDRLTRGGPLARTPALTSLSGGFNSDQRKRWTLGGSASYSWDGQSSSRYELGPSVVWRPGSSWNLELGPRYSRERALAQYVASRTDSFASGTFGRRYVFSALDQKTAFVNARLNVTFKPDLTLELYAQPFVASADFSEVKELKAPGTYSFLRYGVDAGTVTRDGSDLIIDPDGVGPAASFRLAEGDFNRRSLKGNAVVRWEWRPGSTLFLVWQHQRSESVELNRLELGRDVRALFDAPSVNVLALKLSYWFSP